MQIGADVSPTGDAILDDVLRDLREDGVPVSDSDVDRVLDGRSSYDEAGDAAQASIRAAWARAIDADLQALDLRASFKAQGRTRWSHADTDGLVTVHQRDVPDATA